MFWQDCWRHLEGLDLEREHLDPNPLQPMLITEILTVPAGGSFKDRGSSASSQALGLHQAECHGAQCSVSLVALFGHFALRSQDFPNVPMSPGLQLLLLALPVPI